MRKSLVAAVMIVALSLMALPVAAAPPGLPEDNPNKNSIVVPITCEGYNNDEPFLVWIPNANSFPQAGSVGIPLDPDLVVGVEKSKGQGAAARGVICQTPLGPTVIMPTGRP